MGFAAAICLQVPELAHALLQSVGSPGNEIEVILAARFASLVFFIGIVNTCLVDDYQAKQISNRALLGAAAALGLAILLLPTTLLANSSQYLTLLIYLGILFVAGKFFIVKPYNYATVVIASSAVITLLGRFLLEWDAAKGNIQPAHYALARAWTFWLEANCVLVGLVFVMRRRRRQDAKKAIELARQAEKIATIAPFVKASRHDLRAPLTDIIGLANLIADHPLDREQRNHLATITSAARNALNNINVIFSYANSADNSSADQIRPRSEPFQLALIIEECSHFYDADILDRNPELVVRLAENIPTVL
ncbi:MAG: hypothetical protein HKO07_00110, partial [Pseudomonadales bacterium]|nr:hypothetical protein [Pseudomonadales bacterium]